MEKPLSIEYQEDLSQVLNRLIMINEHEVAGGIPVEAIKTAVMKYVLRERALRK